MGHSHGVLRLLQLVAEVTPVAEIGPHSYKPTALTATLIDAYTEEVKPRTKAA